MAVLKSRLMRAKSATFARLSLKKRCHGSVREFKGVQNAWTFARKDGTPTSADQVRVEYHLDGSIDRRKDQRDVVITYSYDNARRQTLQAATGIPASVDSGVESIGRTYDTMGRVTHITSYDTSSGTSALNEIEYVYNATTSNKSGTLKYSYQNHAGTATDSSPKFFYRTDVHVDNGTDNILDNALRVWQIEYPNGARVGFERGNTSASANANNIDDRLNRVTGLDWDADGAGGTYSDVDEVDYAYNGTGRMVKVDYGVPDVRREMFSSGNDYDRWDRFGRTLTQEWEDYTSGTVTRDQVDYTYDAAGNRLTRDIPSSLYSTDDRDQKYTYDGLHRLTNAEGGTYNTGTGNIDSRQLEQDFTLDQLGNWSTFKERDTDTGGTWDLDQDRAHNDVNEIDNGSDNGITTTTGTDWTDPVHDAAGNMTTIPQPKSPSSSYTLKYDAWNRLVEVKDGATVKQANEFDGLNRRIVRDESNGSGVLTHFYYNRQWQVLVEADSNDDPICMYAYHSHYVDAPGTRIDADGIKYYLHDANFNVTAVTDDAGTVKERYAYTPYGEVTFLDANFANPATSSAISNEYLYTGRRLDPETGLQLNRYRFYASHLGRWLNRDPILYIGSRWSLYEYVNGMPINATDPEGKFLITGVIGGLGGLYFCCARESSATFDDFPGSGDSFKHCVTSCRIKDKCGSGISKLCQLLKEGGDYWQGDPPLDQQQDIDSNNACMDTCGYKSCEDCCRDRVGFGNNGFPVKPPNECDEDPCPLFGPPIPGADPIYGFPPGAGGL